MSNPFKWYVYVSVNAGPWQRHTEFANSERGQQFAVWRAAGLNQLVGIEAKVVNERKEDGE